MSIRLHLYELQHGQEADKRTKVIKSFQLCWKALNAPFFSFIKTNTFLIQHCYIWLGWYYSHSAVINVKFNSKNMNQKYLFQNEYLVKLSIFFIQAKTTAHVLRNNCAFVYYFYLSTKTKLEKLWNWKAKSSSINRFFWKGDLSTLK